MKPRPGLSRIQSQARSACRGLTARGACLLRAWLLPCSPRLPHLQSAYPPGSFRELALHTTEDANPSQSEAVLPGAGARRRWVIATAAAGLLGWTVAAIYFLIHPSPRMRSDGGFGIGLVVG